MYNLFNKPNNASPGNVSSAGFDYIKTQLVSNLEKVISYYKKANYSVKSNHFLVDLLNTMHSSTDVPLYQYPYLIKDQMKELVNTFELSSSTTYGKSRPEGIFLGEQVEEVYIATSTSFNIENLKVNWKSTSALRFISHPNQDLGFSLPNGKNINSLPGMAVIEINIPLLACQYALWKDSVKNLEDTPTTMSFIYKYVFTNMLESYLNVSVFNITQAIFNKETIVPSINPHGFYLNTYNGELVDSLREVVETRLDRKESFEEFLEGTVVVKNKSLRETIALPKMPYTRQVLWGLIVARINVAGFLMKWDKETGGSQNRDEINDIKRVLRQLKSDKNLGNLISKQNKKLLEDYLQENIIDLL